MFYIQVDGTAMESPVGPILVNIILSHHEENWLNKCHADGIFVLFESLESA